MEIEDREQIRQKRSSVFSGRKKGRRISNKEISIGAAILAILILAFTVPYFWNFAKDNATLPPEHPKITPVTTPEKMLSTPNPTPSPIKITPSPEVKIDPTSTPPVDLVIGRIGVPLEQNGFEITVKTVALSNIQTSVWIVAKNTGDVGKPLKLNPKPVIIDNYENQYESIIVAHSGIAQSELYPKAKREGAVFFERFKEGTKAQRLIFYVNGDRFEFNLTDEKNI